MVAIQTIKGHKARGRFVARLAASALALSLVLPGAAAAACATASESVALDARVMQTDLMVAALTCQQQSSYNAFVIKYRDELVSSGRTLQSYFSRVHGGNGSRYLNAFVTQMANEASMRSLNVSRFCDGVPALFSETLSTSSGDFKALLARFPGHHAHGIPACTAASSEQQAQRTVAEIR